MADTNPNEIGGRVPGDLTIGELGRSFRRLEELYASLDSKIDSKLDRRFDELTRALQQRASTEHVNSLERELTRTIAMVEELTRALESERNARGEEIKKETDARLRQIEAEKARIGVWFRWLLASVVAVFGTMIANALGFRVG